MGPLSWPFNECTEERLGSRQCGALCSPPGEREQPCSFPDLHTGKWLCILTLHLGLSALQDSDANGFDTNPSSSLPAELSCLLTVSSILSGLLTFIFCVYLNNSQVETSVQYLPRCQDWKCFFPGHPTPQQQFLCLQWLPDHLWLVPTDLQA